MYVSTINNHPISSIRELHSISFNQFALSIYLHEIFLDLQRRSSSTKEQTISRLTFIESLSYPLLINQRLFYAFTNNKTDDSITRTQYVQGFLKLYTGNVEHKLNIIARMFDFNLNGIIHVNDINLLFKQLYIRSCCLYETKHANYKEISNIIYEQFAHKRIVTVSSFKDLIRYYNSDIVCLFCFYLNMFCPFTEEQVNYFKVVTPRIRTHNSNNNIKCEHSKQIQLNNDNGNILTYSKSDIDIKPSNKLLDFLKGNYGVVITIRNSYKEKSSNNVIVQNKSDEIDLHELELFEKDISSTIASVNVFNYDEYLNKDIDNFQQHRSVSTLHNYRCKINHTINNNNILQSSQFEFNSLKSNRKNLQVYSKIKTHVSYKHNSPSHNIQTTQIKYEGYSSSSANFYETHVNYYTRSGSVREAKLLLIGDCLYVHIFNGSIYKFLKLINLKFTHVDEIESYETISQVKLVTVKLSSFLNKHYTEIIFSSQEHLEMKSLISKLYQITNHITLEDNYIIIKEIHNGSMSKIFYGKQKHKNIEVAIKQISLTTCDSLKSYETILWEKDIMNFLLYKTHPNITKVYDVYRSNENMYIISEYIQRGNLQKFLYDYGSEIKENGIMNIMKQIIYAIEFMHGNGIVHRDLKLENILVKYNKYDDIEIKVIDFGFGLFLGRGEVVNDAYGTLNYASPEQLKKIPYNFKTDIWSLGVIFYIMLYKKYPFNENEKDTKKIFNNIINNSVSFPIIQNTLHSKLQKLIEQCLNKEQKHRPNIHEVKRYLHT